MDQRVAAIALTVNGEAREFHGAADTPLLWALREQLSAARKKLVERRKGAGQQPPR